MLAAVTGFPQEYRFTLECARNSRYPGIFREGERAAIIDGFSHPPAAAFARLGHRGRRLVRIWKPGADRILAVILILLSAPVMALLAVMIRVTLGQGVLFRQSRVGQHGRPFNVLKFRTMLPERRRAQVPIPFPDRRCTEAKNDPRHTNVGRFLRRWSLDELPQLFNVVRGQMSLIVPGRNFVGSGQVRAVAARTT